MQIEQRLEFIDSLVMPEIITPRSIEPYNSTINETPSDPNKNGASVLPDTINVYFAGVSQQNRDDVDACKLLMQNAATKMFPNDNQLIDWYKFYVNGLFNLGWAKQAHQLQDYTIKKTGLTMDAVALDVLTGLIGNKALLFAELAGKAVDIIKGDQKYINIYERNLKVGQQTKFDIAPVWQDADGYATMILNCTSVDVRESTKGILWWKSTRQSTSVKSGAVQTYLSPRHFDPLRDAVYEKIGKAGKDFIGKLPDF
jgi:hypothetical protein